MDGIKRINFGWWTLWAMHSDLQLINGFTKPFTTQGQSWCKHSWLYSATKFIKSFHLVNFKAFSQNFDTNLDTAKWVTYTINNVTGTCSISATIYSYFMHWVTILVVLIVTWACYFKSVMWTSVHVHLWGCQEVSALLYWSEVTDIELLLLLLIWLSGCACEHGSIIEYN